MNEALIVLIVIVVLSILANIKFAFGRKYKGCKHKFEPRYSEKLVNQPVKVSGTVLTAKELRSLMVYQEYVHDVCIKCGSVSYDIRKGKS